MPTDTWRATQPPPTTEQRPAPSAGSGHMFDTDTMHRLSILATIAILGQAVLLAAAFLLPLVSEFSLVRDNISELVLGRFGFVQTLAFLIAGAGTLALAYVIRQLTAGTWGSLFGSLMVAIYGIGAMLSAIFPTDRIDAPADVWASSTTGLIHIGISLVSFPCMIVGMYVLFRTFILAPAWRPLVPWIVLFPASALPLFLGQSQGPWVGILQRLLVLSISAWMIVVALRARALVTDATERGLAS